METRTQTERPGQGPAGRPEAAQRQAYVRPRIQVESSADLRRSVFASCCSDTTCEAQYTYAAEVPSQ